VCGGERVGGGSNSSHVQTVSSYSHSPPEAWTCSRGARVSNSVAVSHSSAIIKLIAFPSIHIIIRIDIIIIDLFICLSILPFYSALLFCPFIIKYI